MSAEGLFTLSEIQLAILTDRKFFAWQQIRMFTLTPFWSVFLPNWVVDLFAPKFYSLIQNNIGLNFSDRLNFVTGEHSFTLRVISVWVIANVVNLNLQLWTHSLQNGLFRPLLTSYDHSIRPFSHVTKFSPINIGPLFSLALYLCLWWQAEWVCHPFSPKFSTSPLTQC